MRSCSPRRYRVSTVSSVRQMIRCGGNMVGAQNWWICLLANLSNSASAGQSLRQKRQALIHAVIDAGMVGGELLVAMRNPELVQPSYEPACTVEQVELVLFAAIDVEGFQSAEIVRLAFDRDDGILPRPVRPAFLDKLTGVDCDRQPYAEELRRIGVVAGRHRQRVDHLAGTLGMLLGGFELLPPSLNRVLGAGERAQDCRHVGQVA